MLQIIIWMGCVYFVVKGLEIASRPNLKPVGIAAAVVAFLAAPVFYLVAEAQVASSALQGISTSDDPAFEGLDHEDASAAANAALENAAEAIENAEGAVNNANEALGE